MQAKLTVLSSGDLAQARATGVLGTLLAGELLGLDMRLPFIVVGVLNVVAFGLTFPFFRSTNPEVAPA